MSRRAWALPGLAAFLVLSFAVRAAPLLTGDFVQGGLVHGVTTPGTEVMLDGRNVPVSPSGGFVIGFRRDAPPEAHLVVGGEAQTLTIAKRDWPTRRVDGLPQETVTPDPEQLRRIAAETAEIRALREAPSREEFFAQTMIWPAHGPISGVFGSQSILNGVPRAPHIGFDIAAAAGTPVVAPAGGMVRMAKMLFLTGNTVLLDHGYGLFTSYAHLSRIDVAVGQRIAQSESIGAVGATGRVTGPHLHWGLEWFEVRLDPALVLPKLDAALSPASAGAATSTSPAARGSSPRSPD
ncbi:MAG: peptidase [Rhodospirillales bacterium]|nr:peptidase [Rhodospirillales bacterium]